MWCVDLGAGGQGNGEAHRLAAPLPRAVPIERLRKQRAPTVEAGARRVGDRSVARLQRDRDHRPFGHAHLVGAGQPVGDSRQRQVGAGRDAFVDLHLGEQRIGMLIDMVHHAEEDQRIGNGIAEGRDRHPLGRVPFDRQAEARVAAIDPIAVPRLVGRHG